MKQYTSKFLKSIAVVYLAFPVLHILLAGVLFDIPFNLCIGILLSPFYYVVASAAVAVGYGLWEMRRWAWYLFVITNFLIGYENAVMANLYGESHHKVLAFLGSVVVLILVTYRVGREIRVPYFFPKIRWWESDPRYRLSVPVSLNRRIGEVIEGEIMDVSMSGCFVKLRGDLDIDEDVSVGFSVFGYLVNCHGTVVWRTQSTVTHPKGIGIKFRNLGRTEKRHLRAINRRLRKIAALYRRSRYLLNQEEFLKRLQEIESPRGMINK
ncbi:MAG: hypothetical protein A2428_06105 [Bdellovibrionales bacterium RIFOXYC1_FULL_54_43]|nr:MAG: hypothetical protein A2428_06105 [Bdellovibrionales bacterium RIFOXYC1_FULL_54_43]OFZ84826.1 MAG: hypothetical protein A2603_02885 [Bdellovibrionales bacterium RIFOXYD1_FULL_55_31]